MTLIHAVSGSIPTRVAIVGDTGLFGVSIIATLARVVVVNVIPQMSAS